jgi:cytosine/uracil/thiamine/allantoin permease
VLVDFFVLRGGRLDVDALYAEPEHSPFGSVNRAGLVSLALGVVAAWSWQYGLVPLMQGPIAVALGITDFSWLSGALVAGGLYATVGRRALSPATPDVAPRPAGR